LFFFVPFFSQYLSRAHKTSPAPLFLGGHVEADKRPPVFFSPPPSTCFSEGGGPEMNPPGFFRRGALSHWPPSRIAASLSRTRPIGEILLFFWFVFLLWESGGGWFFFSHVPDSRRRTFSFLIRQYVGGSPDIPGFFPGQHLLVVAICFPLSLLFSSPWRTLAPMFFFLSSEPRRRRGQGPRFSRKVFFPPFPPIGPFFPRSRRRFFILFATPLFFLGNVKEGFFFFFFFFPNGPQAWTF